MVTLYTINNKLVKSGSNFFGIITEPTPPGPSFDEVTIGTQTWMAKNLTIDDGQGGIYTQTVNYGQGDVVEYYYIWSAAVRVAESIEGWHLPSDEEWTTLANAVGGSSVAGTKLKSTYGWNSGNGADDYGFSAFPAGDWYRSSSFEQFGKYANFWTSTKKSASTCYCRYFNGNRAIYSNQKDSYNNGYSIRLVKDS